MEGSALRFFFLIPPVLQRGAHGRRIMRLTPPVGRPTLPAEQNPCRGGPSGWGFLRNIVHNLFIYQVGEKQTSENVSVHPPDVRHPALNN